MLACSFVLFACECDCLFVCSFVCLLIWLLVCSLACLFGWLVVCLMVNRYICLFVFSSVRATVFFSVGEFVHVRD